MKFDTGVQPLLRLLMFYHTVDIPPFHPPIFSSVLPSVRWRRRLLVVAELLADVPWGLGLVGVVLVVLAVMLIIHLFGVLLCLMLSPLLVGKVHAFGLGELVDLGTGETGEELLGKGVVDGLACDEVSFGCA